MIPGMAVTAAGYHMIWSTVCLSNDALNIEITLTHISVWPNKEILLQTPTEHKQGIETYAMQKYPRKKKYSILISPPPQLLFGSSPKTRFWLPCIKNEQMLVEQIITWSWFWNKGSTRTSFLRHQPRSHLQGKSPGNEVVPTLQTAPLPPTHPRARVIL